MKQLFKNYSNYSWLRYLSSFAPTIRTSVITKHVIILNSSLIKFDALQIGLNGSSIQNNALHT